MAEKRGRGVDGFQDLLEISRSLRFEPHDIVGQVDERGRYEVKLEQGFPLLIKLFRFTTRRHTRGRTWHDRLEMFMPLDGPARLRVGSDVVDLRPGDTLLVEALKVHSVLDFPGFDTRVVVTSFLPEFVYTLGSPSHDYAFLLPFYGPPGGRSRVLRRSDGASTGFLAAEARLLDCYFGGRPFRQAGCRVFLLEMLYTLLRHFGASDALTWEFLQQQERSSMLKKLLEHIERNFSERLSVGQAAGLASMSVRQFRTVFRRVSGMKLSSYLNHVRLSNAYRLLQDTDLSIGAIASRVGFADQSYLDRCFKRSFGITPQCFRNRQER